MLAPLQKTKDGPIIAMQIENEYGSFGNDKNYLSYLRGLMRSNGIDVLLFTSDGDNRYYLSGGGLEGELMVTNFNSMPADSVKDLRELQPDKPLMCGEYWCGWFEAWGGKHPKGSAEKLGEAIRQLFDLNASYDLYTTTNTPPPSQATTMTLRSMSTAAIRTNTLPSERQ